MEGMKMQTVHDARRLLWHGSRGCNFGGILSQGLRIAPPEAPKNGKYCGPYTEHMAEIPQDSHSARECIWPIGRASQLRIVIRGHQAGPAFCYCECDW